MTSQNVMINSYHVEEYRRNSSNNNCSSLDGINDLYHVTQIFQHIFMNIMKTKNLPLFHGLIASLMCFGVQYYYSSILGLQLGRILNFISPALSWLCGICEIDGFGLNKELNARSHTCLQKRTALHIS